MPCPVPRRTRTGARRLLPRLHGLPRFPGGSASVSSLSRPAQASLTLRPAELLDRPRRPLSRGFSPVSCPTKPLVRYQRNRQLAGWYLPPLVNRADWAHVESRTGAVAWALCGNAPFPVPAPQRPGRADLSGSSAIAGFRPHRSHRAALPQWALQDGPEADESSVPRLMEDRLRQWEGGQDRLVGRPAHAAFLASLAEHLPP